MDTGLAKWQTPELHRNRPVFRITLGSPIATGFFNFQSPREEEFHAGLMIPRFCLMIT
jgi:hypothetical protein